jgi:hypothetical protein
MDHRSRRRGSTALAALLIAAPAVGPAALAGQGELSGAVLDASTGDTIHVATVSLLAEAGDTLVSRMTSDGSFTFSIREDRSYRLGAVALGYDPVTSDPFEAGTSSGIVVEVRLGPRPVDLPAINVISRRSDLKGPLSDYYRNLEWYRKTGFGRVLDREELERRDPLPVRSILQGEQGLQIYTGRAGQDILAVRRAGRVCAPAIYINGLIAESADLFAIPTSTLEGIEIYRWVTPPVTPSLAAMNDCGLILAWTRTDIGRPFTWGRLLMAGGIVAVVVLISLL